MSQRYFRDKARALRDLNAIVEEHTKLMEAKVREISAILQKIHQDEPIESSTGESADECGVVESCVSTTDYCLCGEPSHGTMIACGNPKCLLVWFHLECVGLEKEPQGDWLCPVCAPISRGAE